MVKLPSPLFISSFGTTICKNSLLYDELKNSDAKQHQPLENSHKKLLKSEGNEADLQEFQLFTAKTRLERCIPL